MKVAVYAIALNEAMHVDRWARSAIEADYRVVADTGSTDDTVERLEKAGVTVHKIAIRPWRFDDARNAALALLPADADVCVTIDMDEFLEPGWRSRLEAAWTPGTTAIWCRKAWRAQPGGPPLFTVSAKKIHSRWGYRCKRAVHEALFFTGGREVTHVCDDIVISEIQDPGKETRKQYLPLLEIAHQEDPGDSQICFWLGREYMWANQPERAIELLQHYLALPTSTWADERSEAMRYLARMQPEKKTVWLDKARIEAPHRREIWLDLAEELHIQSDWLNLFWACANGIEKTRRTGSYLDDSNCWEFRLYDLGAIAAWHLDMIPRAVGWGQKALELARDGQATRLKNNLDFYIHRRDEQRPALHGHRPHSGTTNASLIKLGAKSPKVGILCDIDRLSGSLAYEPYYLVNLLAEGYGYDLVNSMTLDYSDNAALRQLNSFDALIVFGYRPAPEIPLHLISSYKILKIDDLFSQDNKFDELLERFVRNADMIISPYAYTLSAHYDQENVVWVPYSSAIEGCKNYYEIGFNDTPRSKVLVSGNLAFDRPFREYVANLNDNHIDKLPHPGYDRRYDDNSSEFVRANYFKILNQYLCCFTDASVYRYVHLKNFEISSVGSLLLADDAIQSEMNALGFIDYETCIFSSQQNILEKIAWIVDDRNRATVDKIRLAGMRLVRERHLTRHRASQIHALVETTVTR